MKNIIYYKYFNFNKKKNNNTLGLRRLILLFCDIIRHFLSERFLDEIKFI